MKRRVFLFLLVVATLAVAACGVKSNLSRDADDPFPRNYPMY